MIFRSIFYEEERASRRRKLDNENVWRAIDCICLTSTYSGADFRGFYDMERVLSPQLSA